MELLSTDQIHQALLFIDVSVRERNWAEARKWLRRVIPAIHRASALSPSPEQWLELLKTAGEMGRMLVREDKAGYSKRFAGCMKCIGEILNPVAVR